MAEIVLFHHAQGQTAGFAAFADELRRRGHVVHTPDLFEGRTFPDLDSGVAYVETVGFGAIVERGVASVEGLPEDVVYAGVSLGVVPAQQLAQTRPGARGALLFEACVPVTEFGDHWPAAVPVQIHGMDGDPFFAGEGDIDAARALVDDARRTTSAELFVYPGDRHLFTDSSLPSYDEAAATLVLARAAAFLDALEAPPSAPIVEITLDCGDAATMAAFWSAALGYDVVEAGDGSAYLRDPQDRRPFLCLLEVPEPKSVKNRMHFDLVVTGGVPDAQRWDRITREVDRLIALGATKRSEDPPHFVGMADPEGNEFDVT